MDEVLSLLLEQQAEVHAVLARQASVLHVLQQRQAGVEQILSFSLSGSAGPPAQGAATGVGEPPAPEAAMMDVGGAGWPWPQPPLWPTTLLDPYPTDLACFPDDNSWE